MREIFLTHVDNAIPSQVVGTKTIRKQQMLMRECTKVGKRRPVRGQISVRLALYDPPSFTTMIEPNAHNFCSVQITIYEIG
jgi:hypothetical protein